MTHYILINFEKKEEWRFPRTEEDIFFDIEDSEEETKFICNVCFRSFKTKSIGHLEKCRMEWPYEGCKLCKIISNQKMRIYKIKDKKNLINQKIVRAISRLGNFSKTEQFLGLPISTEGILNSRKYDLFGFFQHFYFILFSYKSIVSYVLLEVYQSVIFRKLNIIIRDIFTFPPERKKGYSKKILLEISRQYHKEVEDFLFSAPISKDLKMLLKKMGLNQIRVITRMNFRNIRMEAI